MKSISFAQLFTAIAGAFLLLYAAAGWSSILNVPIDFPTIQAGMDAALVGDVVLVADGIYYENIDFKGKSITVASHYWLDGNERHVYNTQIRGSQPNHPACGSVVLFVSGENQNSILTGFTITRGSGTLAEIKRIRCGGGIFCFNSSPQIRHNRIIENTVSYPNLSYGGGICCLWETVQPSQTVVIEDNVIEDNQASGGIAAYGGGIYVSQSAIINNNRISSNRSLSSDNHSYGGGICCNSPTNLSFRFEILENEVTGNLAKTTSRPHIAMGGGMAIWQGTVELCSNLVMDNHLSSDNLNRGAGLFLFRLTENSAIHHNRFCSNSPVASELYPSEQCFGGGIHLMDTKGILIENNCIRWNVASSGGGLGLDHSSMTFQNNVILGNIAYQDGGGIYLLKRIDQPDSAVVPEDGTAENLLAGNNLFEFYPAEESELIDANPEVFPTPKLYNNTFTQNKARKGGALFSYKADAELINTILWGDQATVAGPEIKVHYGSVYLNYCDIQYGWPEVPGCINLSVNPMFMTGQSCCLSPKSPCIDAGHPSPVFNDPENPKHLGMALPPALGTIRSDMGAFGGPCACGIIPTENTGEVAASSATIETVPEGFGLVQNFPNPFNPTTIISWQLAVGSSVRLSIYDLLGREVAVLVSGHLDAGYHQYEWDASGMASGVYLYRLEAEKFSETKKMMLMR